MPAHIGVVVAVNRPRAETFGLPRQATVTLAAEGSHLSDEADLIIGGPAGLELARAPAGTPIFIENQVKLVVDGESREGATLCSVERGWGLAIAPRMSVIT